MGQLRKLASGRPLLFVALRSLSLSLSLLLLTDESDVSSRDTDLPYLHGWPSWLA